MLSLRSLRWSQVGAGNARLNESLLSSCSGSMQKPRITEPRSRNFLADMGGRYDLAGANTRPTTKNYRSNPEHEMIRKESREPWGGEENRTDLTRQHMEMQAVFLQIFYKVLTLRSIFRLLQSTGDTRLVWRNASCNLRKCLIMLGVVSSRLRFPCSRRPAGEHECLKREFLRLGNQGWRRVVGRSRPVPAVGRIWHSEPHLSKTLKCR